eukprot:TRINITY_DN14930_c0_g1_i1.p1 TRINITY_DN14930_c0_g1~~TRINITY_DN14930_c0_g1_i1.p1  ORF type:complete len:292 (+),score=51.62 TRINITY_DN14930_c0_g1_i1:57-932(+)
MGNGNSIHKIDEGFFICGVSALTDFDRLRSLGIKCILNAAKDDLYTSAYVGPDRILQELPKHFEVKIIGADDAEDCNLSVHFREIADFIEAGRKKGGVIVHCAAGISRATTSCCSYMMIKEHWSLEAAFRRVHAVRSFVHPNAGFWRQLCDLQASLQAQGVVLRSLPSDYQPPTQPPPPEPEEGQRRGPSEDESTSWEDTADLIGRLDKEAAQHLPFVTHFLTAKLEPREGAPEELRKAVMKTSLPGVTWESSSIDANTVTIRAGVVPTMDSLGFRALLSALPGVGSAICE